MDTEIIITSIVWSGKNIINPNSLTKSKIVIDAIIIRNVRTNGIFLVNDLINCDASRLYFESKRREPSIKLFLLMLFILAVSPPFLIVVKDSLPEYINNIITIFYFFKWRYLKKILLWIIDLLIIKK